MPTIPSDENPAHHTRRAFCARTCRLISAATLGTAAAALAEGCSSPTSPSNAATIPTMSGITSGNAVQVTIAAGSPLATVGGAALVQSTRGWFLVARTAQNAFTALVSTCTHAVCTVNGWTGQVYVCPCHGSEFDTSGRVVGGPAPASLPQYATQFANNVLTIVA